MNASSPQANRLKVLPFKLDISSLIPTPMAVTATTNDESLPSKGTFMGMRFHVYDRTQDTG